MILLAFLKIVGVFDVFDCIPNRFRNTSSFCQGSCKCYI